jgi:hypothetical protein
MKQFVGIILFVAVWVGTGYTQAISSKPQPTFVIHGPTVVAFFPITQAEADSGEGNAEALDDFNYYIFEANERLNKAGIEIHIVNEQSFQTQTGKKLAEFQAGKDRVSYYFIAPNKEPHAEYGVMTDEDLLDLARKHFGIAIR